jgi:hypothetical protein
MLVSKFESIENPQGKILTSQAWKKSSIHALQKNGRKMLIFFRMEFKIGPILGGPSVVMVSKGYPQKLSQQTGGCFSITRTRQFMHVSSVSHGEHGRMKAAFEHCSWFAFKWGLQEILK